VLSCATDNACSSAQNQHVVMLVDVVINTLEQGLCCLVQLIMPAVELKISML
jgi:hypothetical protein